MSFDWLNNLQLAKELLGYPGRSAVALETRQRTAISRAFYSVYPLARDVACKIRNVSTRQADQSNTIGWFKQDSGTLAGQKVGLALERLQDLRHCADYEATWSIRRRGSSLEHDVEWAIELADEIALGIAQLQQQGP